MEKKITEKMLLAAIKNYVETETFGADITTEDVVAYCEKRISQIETKSQKAKSKSDTEAVSEKVLSVLTDEFITCQEIADKVGITKGKAVYALNKLAAENKASKGEIALTGKSKAVAYKLA